MHWRILACSWHICAAYGRIGDASLLCLTVLNPLSFPSCVSTYNTAYCILKVFFSCLFSSPHDSNRLIELAIFVGMLTFWYLGLEYPAVVVCRTVVTEFARAIVLCPGVWEPVFDLLRSWLSLIENEGDFDCCTKLCRAGLSGDKNSFSDGWLNSLSLRYKEVSRSSCWGFTEPDAKGNSLFALLCLDLLTNFRGYGL